MKAEIHPFDSIIRQINNGNFLDEVTDELTAVVDAVRQTGKIGKLTVTLSLHPRGSSNEQMEIRPSVKGAAPERERPISLFYVNRDCGLQRDDPTQHKLPGFQSVEPETPTKEKEINSNGR